MRRVGVVVVLLLALAGCAGSRAPEPAPDGAQRVRIDVAGGAVVGGPADWAVPLGSTVELVVGSDVAEEVHVHGYDRRAYVTAGAAATLRFVADLPGVVDVELEGAGVPLGRLAVS